MKPIKPVILVAIGLVVGAIVAALLVAYPQMPGEYSKQAKNVDFLFRYMLAIAGVIFGLVTVVLVYILRTFRAKRGDLSDGAPVHGVTWLEIVWTAIPAVLVVSIALLSWQTLDENEQALAKSRSGEAIHVHVWGYQFNWEYAYTDQQYTLKSSPELVLPVDRPVVFELETKDVIHSFWVPKWRIQMNTTPGQKNRMTVTPTKMGSIEVVCAFLCGAAHATMNSSVGSAVKPIRVVSEQDFEKWIKDQQAAEQQSS